MKTALVAAIAGALSGALIAAGVARTTRDGATAASTAPVAPKQEAPSVAVPHGWDLRFVGRLASVEDRLANLEKRPFVETSSDPPTHAHGSRAKGDREQQIAQQYEDDLKYQQDALESHAAEPLDEAWARAQNELVAARLKAASNADYPRKIGQIDCRSRTCVVQTVYPSPEAALVARRALVGMETIPTCRGSSSALEKPTDAGPYTVKVIYYCRN